MDVVTEKMYPEPRQYLITRLYKLCCPCNVLLALLRPLKSTDTFCFNRHETFQSWAPHLAARRKEGVESDREN